MNRKLLLTTFFFLLCFAGSLTAQVKPETSQAQTASLERKTKAIVVRIIDEHALLTAARIRVTGNDSIYFAPQGHSVDFPITERGGDLGQGGDVILDNNRRFAYVEGEFKIDLPESERIRFEVVKGFTYRFLDSAIKINPGTDTINLLLEKWFDFPSGRKWYSGDVHTHEIDSATALLAMKAGCECL